MSERSEQLRPTGLVVSLHARRLAGARRTTYTYACTIPERPPLMLKRVEAAVREDGFAGLHRATPTLTGPERLALFYELSDEHQGLAWRSLADVLEREATR